MADKKNSTKGEVENVWMTDDKFEKIKFNDKWKIKKNSV